MQDNVVHLPRMRVISKVYEEIKAADPNTSVSMNFLRRKMLSGEIPSVRAGNKRLVSMEAVYEFLNKQPTDCTSSITGIRKVSER